VRIDGDHRRRLLVSRQLALGLDAPGRPAATTPEEVADRLVALHATDPSSVHLAVLARVPDLTLDDVQAALHVRAGLVKLLAMRRTVFAVPRDLVPVVHAAASADVAPRLRARLLKELATLPTEPPVEDPDALLAAAESQVLDVLREHGPADGTELTRRAPLLRTAFLPATTRAWDVRRHLTAQLLPLLSAQARIVRGAPKGAWTSSRHVWSPMTDLFPDGVPDVDPSVARRELARRWLEAFGPATEADLRWWTGWNLGRTRAALADLDLREVEVDVAPPGADPALVAGVVLRGADLDAPAVDDHVALLPPLDPTTMGWTHRDWYLGDHRPALFDSAGNAGATVWWQGRVVGAWTVREGGDVAHRLLEDVGADGAAAVGAEAARLGTHLAGSSGTVVASVTPLYRELRASPG
jgi:hypothetical protein